MLGRVVHLGTGGPGNPVMAGAETILASYHAALADCPAAGRVVACVSGTSQWAQRAQIERLLTAHFPAARIRVLPDYAGCLSAAPDGTDVCVVAGTGSVVCSLAADDSYRVTGGRGWILGDHGSAARLGRAALEHFVTEPERASAAFADAVGHVFGGSDPQAIMDAVYAAPNAAPLLARAAPLLTAAAEAQLSWAVTLLRQEMTALAATTVRHVDQHVPAASEIRVALSGGVWASHAAQAAFTEALEHAASRAVAVARSPRDALDGAVLLATAV